MTQTPLSKPVNEEQIRSIMERQRAAQADPEFSSYRNRLDRIDRVLQATLQYREAIREALRNDFGKPRAEVDLSEILTITTEAKYIKKNLRRWMRDRRVATPLTMVGTRSYIHYEPKGVVLIIAPWNFPYQLLMGPLLSALAAGNSVVLKPSEMTTHTSALLAKIIGEIFQPEEVTLFEGAVETSQRLLKQPFNHIFFTGSPRVGKIVMEAAAKNLASVTLELGGKSPTIIDESADLKKAAGRMLWAKVMNAGQICISPDYVYVHESVKDQLLDHLRDAMEDFFGGNPRESGDYTRMVNEQHYERVRKLLDEAVDKGARIEFGGQTAAEDRYISPTALTNVPADCGLMQEEIFGPLLPILSYRDLSEPIAHIRAGEKPLAMYIFSRNRKHINRLLAETSAGGTSINIGLLHFFNHHLPFGGVNNSGIGKSHGVFGFRAFSNARAVCEQGRWLPAAADILRTPYTDFKQRVIDRIIKWF